MKVLENPDNIMWIKKSFLWSIFVCLPSLTWHISCINVDFYVIFSITRISSIRNWYSCYLISTELEPFFNRRNLWVFSIITSESQSQDVLSYICIGKVHIGTCMKHDAKPYLSQGTDLVVVVVLKHPTPGLHHGTLQTTRQSCEGREASSWLVKPLPSLNTVKSDLFTDY